MSLCVVVSEDGALATTVWLEPGTTFDVRNVEEHRIDENDPDLYVKLMTYTKEKLLLTIQNFGLHVRGIQSASKPVLARAIIGSLGEIRRNAVADALLTTLSGVVVLSSSATSYAPDTNVPTAFVGQGHRIGDEAVDEVENREEVPQHSKRVIVKSDDFTAHYVIDIDMFETPHGLKEKIVRTYAKTTEKPNEDDERVTQRASLMRLFAKDGTEFTDPFDCLWSFFEDDCNWMEVKAKIVRSPEEHHTMSDYDLEIMAGRVLNSMLDIGHLKNEMQLNKPDVKTVGKVKVVCNKFYMIYHYAVESKVKDLMETLNDLGIDCGAGGEYALRYVNSGSFFQAHEPLHANLVCDGEFATIELVVCLRGGGKTTDPKKKDIKRAIIQETKKNEAMNLCKAMSMRNKMVTSECVVTLPFVKKFEALNAEIVKIAEVSAMVALETFIEKCPSRDFLEKALEILDVKVARTNNVDYRVRMCGKHLVGHDMVLAEEAKKSLDAAMDGGMTLFHFVYTLCCSQVNDFDISNLKQLLVMKMGKMPVEDKEVAELAEHVQKMDTK